MKIRIVNRSRHSLQENSTVSARGTDIRASLEEEIILKPMEGRMISDGLYLEIREGYEAQIRHRSGLALNGGITDLN
jgi:dUTP pyrophosphatase